MLVMSLEGTRGKRNLTSHTRKLLDSAKGKIYAKIYAAELHWPLAGRSQGPGRASDWLLCKYCSPP
jgi:hypothetical protein